MEGRVVSHKSMALFIHQSIANYTQVPLHEIYTRRIKTLVDILGNVIFQKKIVQVSFFFFTKRQFMWLILEKLLSNKIASIFVQSTEKTQDIHRDGDPAAQKMTVLDSYPSENQSATNQDLE